MSQTKTPRTYSTEWTPIKAARLALMIAHGESAKTIAADPEFNTTETNIWRQASRLGLSFRDHPVIKMPREALATLQAAAKVRQMTPQSLVSKILNAVGAAPTLIDSVLDDGHRHTPLAPPTEGQHG